MPDPERERLVRAVEDEPELPGIMPDSIWDVARVSRFDMAEVMRAAVRSTKKNILARVLAAYDAAHKEKPE